jgi:hypothetical protein
MNSKFDVSNELLETIQKIIKVADKYSKDGYEKAFRETFSNIPIAQQSEMLETLQRVVTMMHDEDERE